METAYEMLAAQPFLSGLSPRQLDKLSYWSKKAVFHAGARLFREGSRANRFWLIKDGLVALDTSLPGRGEVVVEELGPGAVLGWSWLYPPFTWHFGATAVETTLAIELDGPGLRELFRRDPEIGYEMVSRFMAVVTHRLQATRTRLVEIQGLAAEPVSPG